VSSDVLLLQATDDAPSSSTTVVARQTRGARIPPRALAAIVVVLGLVAVLAIVRSGGEPAASPATTASTSTTRPTASTTDPGPSTTAAPPVPVPLLPVPTGFTLVASISTGLLLVDFDTGITRRIDVVEAAGSGQLVPRTGGVVSVNDSPLFVPLPSGQPVIAVPMPSGATAVNVFPATTPDHMWLVEYQNAGKEQAVEVDLFGAPAGPVIALPSASFVVGAVDGGLLVGAAGGIYVLGGNGTANRVGSGMPLAAAGHIVVVSDCGANLECGLRIDDLATGESRAVVLSPGAEPAINAPPVISADGSRIAVVQVSGGISGLASVDAATGASRDVPSGAVGLFGTAVTWSPDGQWLFSPVGRNGVRAWHVGDAGSTLLSDQLPVMGAFIVVPRVDLPA
jgi:hypothetical protein